MSKIASRDNQKIKFARAVRDGREREFVFVEGARLSEEVLKSSLKIREIFFTENFAASERGKNFLNRTGDFPQTEVSESVFESLADTKTSQGVVLLCAKPETGKSVIEENLTRKKSNSQLVVALHQINNPSNLGAILRTAEAVDVSGVVLTKNSADVFSPKAIRGAMGASFRLPLWTNADFTEVLNWARAQNLKSVCADVNAEKFYTEIDWTIPRLLMMGSEAHGLNETERAQIDESLLIPMANDVESLNVAVACGVILYQWKMNDG
jgi:RNA methyltransferase, TrmH family